MISIIWRWAQWPIIWISSLLILGCSPAGHNTVLQNNQGLTMAEIYRQEAGLAADGAISKDQALLKSRHMSVITVRNSGPDQQKPAIDGLFKELPNPQIALYIYPHLVTAGDDVQPVPAYTTAFFLYQKNHFALPSERGDLRLPAKSSAHQNTSKV